MRVGLYNLEPKIVNTAMMQVSSYHKRRGDDVEPYSPLFLDTYDKVYCFSLFDFTPKHYVKPEMHCGGTGFDIHSRLPPEIESCDYDWSLYPKCDFSLVWFSRGCIRNCSFCCVRQKEGFIHPVEPRNLNPRGKHIKVMDNNFFANKEWRSSVKQLLEWDQPVDMQGVDVRIMTREMAEALNKLRHHKQIHIAWDNPRDNLKPKLEKVLETIKPHKLMCYVLIGYWSTEEEDLRRVETLRSLKIDPYVMVYDKRDWYQRNFRDWVNGYATFRSCSWAQWRKYAKKGDPSKAMQEAMKHKSQRKLEPKWQEQILRSNLTDTQPSTVSSK